jgi:hypothetical protein
MRVLRWGVSRLIYGLAGAFAFCALTLAAWAFRMDPESP